VFKRRLRGKNPQSGGRFSCIQLNSIQVRSNIVFQCEYCPLFIGEFVIFLSALFFQTLQCVHRHPEKKLKNTFGWARIEVVLMLGGCVFLASLSFSLVVEAIQTLIHIDHQDPMHQPISVFIIGLVGILVHGLCCLLLGGIRLNAWYYLYTIDATILS